MRDIKIIEIVGPATAGFTSRVDQTTAWVRAKPSWLVRMLAFAAIVLAAALLFAVIIPLALVAIVLFVILDVIGRVRRGIVRLVTRNDAVPPDNKGRRNVRVRDRG